MWVFDDRMEAHLAEDKDNVEVWLELEASSSIPLHDSGPEVEEDWR